MAEENESTKSKNINILKKPIFLIGIIGITVFIIIFSYLINLYFFDFDYGQDQLAQFGDFMGGTLNPFLAFFTIGLLVWSIQIQVRELRETRKEIGLIKEETTLSRQSMESQVTHLEKSEQLKEINQLLQEQAGKYKTLLNAPLKNINGLHQFIRNGNHNNSTITINTVWGNKTAKNLGFNTSFLDNLKCIDVVKKYDVMEDQYENIIIFIKQMCQEGNNEFSAQWKELSLILSNREYLIFKYLDISHSEVFINIYLDELYNDASELQHITALPKAERVANDVKDYMQEYYK